MLALAEVADRYGTGELRLTVWQNLIIPNIASTNISRPPKQAILAAGLNFDAGTVLSGTVACTGNKGCRFSATDTKTHAVALANISTAASRSCSPSTCMSPAAPTPARSTTSATLV